MHCSDVAAASALQSTHQVAAIAELWSFASHMKALVFVLVALAVSCCSITALGDSRDMPLSRKIRSLPVVAEVRIIRVEVRRDAAIKSEDLFCDCEVLQAFRLPFATNRLTLRMNFAAPAAKYEGKKAFVFAFESQYGHFSPYRGKPGFILENEKYHDSNSRKGLEYTELIRQVKSIIAANPQGGANGRQPSGSSTNSTSAAPASRR